MISATNHTMNTRKSILSIVLLYLLFITACGGRSPVKNLATNGAPAETMSATSHAVDRREIMVPEPIFHGTVFIVEAGMQHDQSVVLVHGAGDRASRDWDLVIPELAKGYHVLAFDLPGFGRSSKSNIHYSSTQYIAFIKWLAGNHIDGPFALIGHSMGGGLALRYAAEHPEDISRLVLVDAVGVLHWVSLLKSWFSPDDTELQSGATPRSTGRFDDFIRNLLDNISTDKTAEKMNGVLQNDWWRRLVLGGDPNRIAGLSIMLDNIIDPIDGIRTPTLLVWGERDAIAPFRTAKALLGWLPAVHLEIMPKAGHVPMLDQPMEFSRLIKAELASDRIPKPAPLKISRKEPVVNHARFEHQRGVVLTGRYKTIELIGCRGVRISNAIAEQIIANDSEVAIEDSRINGHDVALSVSSSEIIATNVVMEADISISASNSHLDLAGVKLIARKQAAISTDNRSVFVFSISHEQSPAYSGLLHGTRHGNENQPPLASQSPATRQRSLKEKRSSLLFRDDTRSLPQITLQGAWQDAQAV